MIAELLLVGIGAALILWFSWKKGFFLWKENTDWNRGFPFSLVILGFAIYFGVSYGSAVFYQTLFPSTFSTTKEYVRYATWLNFFISFTILSALLIFWRCFPLRIRSNLWKDSTEKRSYAKDFQMSLIAWLITFPIVLFINQLLELFLYRIIGIEEIPDQLAVRFVKMTAQYPSYFFLALISVVIMAPIIEEFLFRGLLQTYIRSRLGAKQAILITSICFSFFHFSFEQGLGNLPIVGSLFPLALFLGFLYERQHSLFASIGLHSLFNLFSIINLYFLGGIPCA